MSDPIKNNWFKIIIVLLTSGFIGQVIGVWDVTVKRDDDYINRYIQSQDRVVLLNRKIDELNNRLTTLELASYEIPFPYWIKDNNSVIMYANKEYRNKILTPLNIRYIDFVNTKGEILGKEFSESIIKNDKIVLRSKNVMKFKEQVPNFGMGTSFKYPIFNNYHIPIGTAGLWIPDNQEF